jgi:riboflavin synthase
VFTGLITAVGSIESAVERDGGREFTVLAPWDDVTMGESIAVDGACLTVTACAPGRFTVHIVVTSLDRTAFGEYVAGRRVNLERALRVGDRLGGHLVQGHVDGVGTVTAVMQRDDAWLIDVAVPAAVAEVSIPLGSITVDGVSLTVNAMPAPGVIQLSIIPFTLEHTTLGERRVGDRVQLEGDTVGKYVRALGAAWRNGEAS